MGYQVKSGGLQENSTRSPRCIAPLYILLHRGSCYNNMFTSCLSTMLLPHVLLLIFNLHCTCAHHVYTMRNPCPLTSSLTLTLIQTSLNPSRPLVLPDHSRLYHMTSQSRAYLLSFFRCRLIIIILNPSPSLSTHSSYNIHDLWFKQFFVCQECCFPLISFFNLYIVVFPDKIQFVEILGFFQLVNDFSYQQ